MGSARAVCTRRRFRAESRMLQAAVSITNRMLHVADCRAHAMHASRHTAGGLHAAPRTAHAAHSTRRMLHASFERRHGTIRHLLEAQRVRCHMARRLLPILGQQQRQGPRCRGPPAHFQHGDELIPAWAPRPAGTACNADNTTDAAVAPPCVQPAAVPYREAADWQCTARVW